MKLLIFKCVSFDFLGFYEVQTKLKISTLALQNFHSDRDINCRGKSLSHLNIQYIGRCRRRRRRTLQYNACESNS